jgi:hypothetical protein
MSKLSSRVAARYLKAQEEACDGPGMTAAPMAPPQGGQEQQAFPQSKAGQSMLLDAISDLQDAFDARDDDAMQKAIEKVKKSSAPGR